MSAQQDYWMECISNAAEECNLEITKEQLECLAESVKYGHEEYGMAFYSPPASDYYEDEKRKLENKLKEARLEAEKIREDFIKNICMRRNCEPNQVMLEGNGYATILS